MLVTSPPMIIASAGARCTATLTTDAASSASYATSDDGCDDDAFVSVLPLDGATVSSSFAAVETPSVSAVVAPVSHRQLRRLVSRDDPSLSTDRLLPAADAELTLSASVLTAWYPESGLLWSSCMLGDGKNASKSPSVDCSWHYNTTSQQQEYITDLTYGVPRRN